MTIAALFIATLVSALAGHWTGYMESDSARLRVTFDFSGEPVTEGHFSSLDLGAIDVPLRNVREGEADHWELVGDSTTTVFDGVVTGDKLEGRFSETQRQGTFTLERASGDASKPYSAQEVSFRNGDVRLAGSLFIPNGPAKHAAVIFVHGSGGEGRWASAYLADFAARHGMVALIYDKRGVGSSSGDWRTATPQELIADARAGVDFLSQVPEVDQRRIGVYGHSQGGQFAPGVAANNDRVAWIIDADGPIGPQYQQDIFRVDTALAHRYSGQELSNAEKIYAEFVDVARSGAPHAQLRSDMKAVGDATWMSYLAIPDDSSWIWAWYKNYGNYDNSSAWAAIRVPVLILFGANDELVPPQQTIDQTVRVLKTHGDSDVSVHLFAAADHTLHVPPNSPNGWPTLPPEFPDIIATFAMRNQPR